MTSSIFNGTYEIKSVIGRGGMSTVYLAEHARLHTKWAVKEVRKLQGVKFDFLAESNILKRLQHPMLPRIVDIFEDDQCIYIVEDFVEGQSLDKLLEERKRVDEKTGLKWFKDLCGVLKYLHGQKPNPIIYRDLKPANIMLQPDGTLKLIDFGIAREYKEESASDTSYVGTKGYAAPEQFGAAQTDARTDIYSLGVTMYHILTGKSPYEPPYNFVPARQIEKSLSHGIEVVLGKCVRSEPKDRYQNVDELLWDIDHMYRYDRAWGNYVAKKWARGCLIAVMAAVSALMIYNGAKLMGQETEQRFYDKLSEASEMYTSEPERAQELLNEARALYPDRPEPDRQETYLHYLNGRWQECVDLGTAALEKYGPDGQVYLTVASAQFELGDYEGAAKNFYAGAQTGELTTDNMRDYAVALGRTGDIEGATHVMEQLEGQDTSPDVTSYVQGEVYYAGKDYVNAEAAFLNTLDLTEDNVLRRRCYTSLGELYRDCTALVRIGQSPIRQPASKSVEVLSAGIMENALRYDATLWELLAMAYFESYHIDQDAPSYYLNSAADCFNQVISLGISKPYLYANLYSIYYEQGAYDRAEEALEKYEQAFPEDYMPNALRSIMLITVENAKPQEERDYAQAYAEYELAGSKIRSSDDTIYYQQVESLINELRSNGWLEG